MKRLLLALLCLGLVGCATTTPFSVNVDSINRTNLPSGTKYMIASGNKDVNQDDLQFMEYVSYVKRALMLNNFLLVKNVNEADVLIFLSYGIGEPAEHQYSYSSPIYGQTGVSSSTTTGSVTSFGNMATGSATTTYTPTYGVVGSSTHSGTFVTYTRFFALKAIDAKKVIQKEAPLELWSTKVISTGTSDDLRRVFPVMVAAAKPYIGKNTGNKIVINLNEGDDVVWEIKGNEFLKPAVSIDKVGFYGVDYKENIKGLGVLCRANLESGSLVLMLGLKNNTSQSIHFDIKDLLVNYGGSNLYKFNKSEAENRLLEKGTKDNMKKATNDINEHYLESHSIVPNEHYLGYVYFSEPSDILNGNKVEIEFSFDDSKVKIPFEYQGGWMTMKAFKEKFKLD